ncbi:MAG: macA 4 [Firmicutes bacterium]|nr:macA 4 [Bacillota bacterium]
MQEIWKKSWRYKNWIIIVLILIAAGWGGYTYYYNKNAKPVSTGTAVAIERGDILASVSATGTISAVNSVDVSSRITGLIKQVHVRENDRVKAGQVLIVLDDTSLRSQLSQVKSQLTNASLIYSRSQRLAAIGGEPTQQLDTDRMNYEVAQAAYENSLSQLEYTVITAPIDGQVIGKPIPAGQTVAPGISNPMVLLTVADLSKMQIQVQVDETDIGRVKLGQKVDFTVDAYPGKTFAGTVTLISEKAVIQQNVVYYTIYVDVEEPQGLLFPTMTARVTIKIGESKNALLVPLSAIKETKGQKYIQIVVDDKPQSVQVQLGLSNDEKAEIISGVKEGDKVWLPGKSAGTAGQAAPGTTNPLRGLSR